MGSCIPLSRCVTFRYTHKRCAPRHHAPHILRPPTTNHNNHNNTNLPLPPYTSPCRIIQRVSGARSTSAASEGWLTNTSLRLGTSKA